MGPSAAAVTWRLRGRSEDDRPRLERTAGGGEGQRARPSGTNRVGRSGLCLRIGKGGRFHRAKVISATVIWITLFLGTAEQAVQLGLCSAEDNYK